MESLDLVIIGSGPAARKLFLGTYFRHVPLVFGPLQRLWLLAAASPGDLLPACFFSSGSVAGDAC